jgi:hypothetical protein
MNWISVEKELPKGLGAIVKVKRESGEELKAYYHSDKMAWLAFYHKKHKCSYWQCFKTRKWLYDVTDWMSLKPPKEQEGK